MSPSGGEYHTIPTGYHVPKTHYLSMQAIQPIRENQTLVPLVTVNPFARELQSSGDSLPKGARPILKQVPGKDKGKHGKTSAEGKDSVTWRAGRHGGRLLSGCPKEARRVYPDGVRRPQTREEKQICTYLIEKHLNHLGVRESLYGWARIHVKEWKVQKVNGERRHTIDWMVLSCSIGCCGWKPSESEWLRATIKQKTIARKLGVSIRTVERSISRLKARGLIGIEPRCWHEGVRAGQRRCSVITLYPGQLLHERPKLPNGKVSDGVYGKVSDGSNGKVSDQSPSISHKELSKCVTGRGDENAGAGNAQLKQEGKTMGRASRLGVDTVALPVDVPHMEHVELPSDVSTLPSGEDEHGGGEWAYVSVDWHRYPGVDVKYGAPAERRAVSILRGKGKALDGHYYSMRDQCLELLSSQKVYVYATLLRVLIDPAKSWELIKMYADKKKPWGGEINNAVQNKNGGVAPPYYQEFKPAEVTGKPASPEDIQRGREKLERILGKPVQSEGITARERMERCSRELNLAKDDVPGSAEAGAVTVDLDEGKGMDDMPAQSIEDQSTHTEGGMSEASKAEYLTMIKNNPALLQRLTPSTIAELGLSPEVSA